VAVKLIRDVVPVNLTDTAGVAVAAGLDRVARVADDLAPATRKLFSLVSRVDPGREVERGAERGDVEHRGP
jgi:hypothetical protein